MTKIAIRTDEQEFFLNCLHKYSQYLYKFSDYNNTTTWLMEEDKIDKTINSVMSGDYIDDSEMIDYINVCILDVEQLERETK